MKKESYDDDKSRLPPHIESRVARERPCRTLFVRNVQYDISESEIRAMFEKFGEVKDVFNLIENRGMIFITFYDVRCSEAAKNEMQGVTLRDRQIDVHYSLPKEEEEKAKCDRTKNQGTLLYTLKNSSSPLDDFELHQYFSSFGEVKAIRIPNFKKAHLAQNYDRNQRLVEFYDSRSCVSAYDSTIDKEYKGGRWDVAFFWDHPYKERINAGKRERIDRREREKTRQPPRRDSFDRYYTPPPPASSSASVPPPPSLPTPAIPMQASSTYNQPLPVEVNQRLEQAQKAQQILSMLATQQTYPPPPPVNSSPVPPQQPQLLQQPYSQPPMVDEQANQVQTLLGLLTQAAAQQQQQHQQQQPPPPSQPTMPQQQQQEIQYAQTPMYTQQQQQPLVAAAPIPGMDPATALSQLAALLQQQQQQLQ
ncbi:hypothetical protein G6F46_002822 [Rhizopus delemar]|uniref:RRM domain-containing protein n=2 Tax=Rhizopus TaxID=4842 RepID=A0A9P7CQL8_9FUNG|nr:hypothetical protein G6F55_009344 [Rhizopus delemar]KAG1538485.1 hypothetical protein G6F51_009746 [Rhizopus arrhizus]KAG1492670.1 hypothetical protein G6F54_009139 [Rhizopus delemar]KAG1506690.1 hypothetical protein G6F53_009510 [Rhizopus delemar]KAG1520829.1 hypothetical protein G6F52_007304 [Rhizopus delemar]